MYVISLSVLVGGLFQNSGMSALQSEFTGVLTNIIRSLLECAVKFKLQPSF